jgi:hypothetical protein
MPIVRKTFNILLPPGFDIQLVKYGMLDIWNWKDKQNLKDVTGITDPRLYLVAYPPRNGCSSIIFPYK